ncbi:MAG: tyrosine/phenylalanine carboxypeptidase domain-containing protein [Microgenomates group bacterium]
MSFLSDLTPINFQEEKARFFEDQTYNPQFKYNVEIPEKKLSQYGMPKLELVHLAEEILKKAYFGRNQLDLEMLEGPELTQQQVSEVITAFLEMHDLQDRYQQVWSSSFVARTTISSDTIKLRLPVAFRKEGLRGMIYHEIGTHALRRINYEAQPWLNKKKEYGFGSYLTTEEGLASLHSLLPKSFKLAYIPALRYLGVYTAQTSSFVELWKVISKYIQDPDQRWRVAVRQKRGQKDTSQPGGYNKDQVYFEGMTLIWKWLHANNFDCTNLYYGKLAMEDVPTAITLNPDYIPILPSFYVTNPEQYAKKMIEIGQENGFDQFATSEL